MELNRFVEHVKTVSRDAMVVHIHLPSYDSRVEDEIITFIVYKGARKDHVYDLMITFNVASWMNSAGDFIAKHIGSDIDCNNRCETRQPSVNWTYKSWNTKWDEDDGVFYCDGKLIYNDPVNEDISVEVPMHISYTVTEDWVWSVDFVYGGYYGYDDGNNFKKLTFKSNSTRYAKNKMMDIANSSMIDEFWRGINGLNIVYGELVSVALSMDGFL